VEAFLCDTEECGFISKNCSVVVQHCNQAHGWHSSKKDPEHWTDVKVQTFFTRGSFQHYFTVHVPEEQKQETRRAELGDCEGFVAATLRAWKKTDKDYKRSQEVADAQTANRMVQLHGLAEAHCETESNASHARKTAPRSR